MTTIQQVELGALGPLQVRRFGLPVAIPGAKPRAVLTMLGLCAGSVVGADLLVELLWGDDPPRTAAKALQTHISALRRALGDGCVLTQGTGWTLCATAEVDAARYKAAATLARDAMGSGNAGEAVARFDEALTLWRGAPELPDGRRGQSERTRWVEGHAALVEDRAEALLATGRAAEITGELEAAIADAPLRERRWGQLMLALYRAGRQGEALAAYQRVRSLLAEELGVDPGPDLRRLEAAIVAQDDSLELPIAQQHSVVTRAVTFLLTDIEASTAAWEKDADAMAVALARHDEIVEQVVTSRGGRLIKTRGEGDATFSVFDRPSAAAAAAVELQESMRNEPWSLAEPVRVRVALHTGEVEFRDGDYFGRAVNRAARLRSLAAGGQTLCSGATAELVIDTLSDDVILADLGTRQLKNLVRPERVFELRLETASDARALTVDTPVERPALPAVLAGPGPFVGRGGELEHLLTTWHASLSAGAGATLIAGEPGVGKTRLAGEWSRRAYEQGAVVLYGRCDEGLGAPYQPFAEAMRALVPCMGTQRLRGMRGVEALLPLVPGLADVLPDLAPPPRADADTERYALFDAVVGLLAIASADTPVVLILDDLHWAAKPTLLLLRHLLRFGEHARVQIVGTYRSTDLDRSHPLAAMLADLNRDGSADRLQLGGLGEDDVTTYVAASGYDDEDLARALASVTGGNPFFLIEALRHVDESGGRWDPSTLPQGVREAVSRRLSRLPVETNKALAAAAVVGGRFSVELVERVVEQDLVDAFDEASRAGIVIEEPGGRYRFNHAIVRQSLLAELASVRRMRLHQRIAVELETEAGVDDEVLAELAYHYFECAWAGNAVKAVDYCRRAADQAMARLAYEGAADLYDKALHALAELDADLPDRDEQQGELLIARCEALLAAGDVTPAIAAVAQLRSAAGASGRIAAWGTCFDGQLSVLTNPERLDEVELAVDAAAATLAELGDAAGEAKAHTVRATCLGRLGRIGDCETALDRALTAARRAHEHRRVNAVLANAPLAALWGPNPVPRAGGRCLDVVRLLRITTGSPVVEATSTRCQGVLDAFRGRASAGRQLIDSARRSLTDLGMRHALMEVEQFAGVIELVADEPAAAEEHLRLAYNGFRRMGLDADTAETAALLARACLALGREAEADELCAESEGLAGHALKASISWRTVRAQLLARSGAHDEARRVAQDAVSIAERTDALVDHGDACLTLAAVLSAAGDTVAARTAAARALELYEAKGAAALAEKARALLDVGPPVARAADVEASSKPDNACARMIRLLDEMGTRDAWGEAEQLFAPTVAVESRRKIVGSSRRDLSHAEWVREARHFLETGVVRIRRVVMAVRGDRLALFRTTLGTADRSPGAAEDQLLHLMGLDEEGRIALHMSFDVEDFDAAIAELDARCAAGEAAAHASTWSVVAGPFTPSNRRQAPAMPPDRIDIDHRSVEPMQDGAVSDSLDDLETALARFGETSRPTARLENTASRVYGQVGERFSTGDWGALSKIMAPSVIDDDRRHVVNAGIRRGRDAVLATGRAVAETGTVLHTMTTIATRGERLALCSSSISECEPRPGAFRIGFLSVVEVDVDDRLVAHVGFDLDDRDAAFTELDARFLAGEAAEHAQTWSATVAVYAAFNRGELPSSTPDSVSVDHRRGAGFAPGELPAYLQAAWEDSPGTRIRIEAVHRLTDRGAVVTHAAQGVSRDGFDAEWRDVSVGVFDGGLLSRTELFDLDDLDAALERFDELDRPTAPLENAASREYQRFNAHYTTGDWDELAKTMADGFIANDRRRFVGMSEQLGRSAAVDHARVTADLGVRNVRSTVRAIRGECLALMHARFWGRDDQPDAFFTEVLHMVEINADHQIIAFAAFDADDVHTAVTELDARYLAGEAAPHANTWSFIVQTYAGFNQHELSKTTPDWVNIDHRRGVGSAPGDMNTYVSAFWSLVPDIRTRIEAVHRLSDLGAVFTHTESGRSHEGFEAEWREVALLTLDGDAINRCELFDETDLGAALARFDGLSRPALGLENAASRANERLAAAFAASDWKTVEHLLHEDFVNDDRRHVVNAGVRHGRDAEIDDLRATSAIGFEMLSWSVVATRGENLAITRARYARTDERSDGFYDDVVHIVEINADTSIASVVIFDPDDLDAAMAELDSRYLAGEAAAHEHTWSAITNANAAFNRREMPATTPDWVNVDHRRGGMAFAPGDQAAYMRATWDVASHISNRIVAVHRLAGDGVVFTQLVQATSDEGFNGEWRDVVILMLDGGMISRCEVFDEGDLDTALARFDELGSGHSPTV